MLNVCFAGLRSFGVDGKRALESLRSVRSVDGRTPFAKKMFRAVDLMARLAQEWMENPLYLGPSGRPKVLSVYGKGVSFAALVRRHFGRRKVNVVLEFAIKTGVLERVGSDKVAQVNPFVMVTGDPNLVLARTVLSIRWLIDVAKRNGLRSSDKAGLVPERMAFALVPKERSAAFAELMRPQLSNVTEMANGWLTQYAVRDQSRQSGTELVGVHTYVFRD
jgi:hypothetical protein